MPWASKSKGKARHFRAAGNLHPGAGISQHRPYGPRSPVVHLQEETVLHTQVLVPYRLRLKQHPMDLSRNSLALDRHRSVNRLLRVFQQSF